MTEQEDIFNSKMSELLYEMSKDIYRATVRKELANKLLENREDTDANIKFWEFELKVQLEDLQHNLKYENTQEAKESLRSAEQCISRLIVCIALKVRDKHCR
jgi:hypothetical protein